MERWYFHWVDWLVFATMLSVSAGAGLWQYKRVRKVNTEDYLLGGKSLGVFPVSASLVASMISGVTILGTPAEIYNFGTQYYFTIIPLFVSGFVVSYIYLPVFKALDLNSVYEYLEIRFSRSVRILISIIFVVDVVLFQSIVVYVPSLALNQVSGINIHLIGSIVCITCVFYTVLGGLRAVVWTDALQVSVMILAVICISILGTISVGGPAEVWKIATEAKRIEFFNVDPSLYVRHTVWSTTIGNWVYIGGYIAVNQTVVQRYKSLRTLKKCRLAIMFFIIGVATFTSVCAWCGLVLLAHWSKPKCDPRATGLINADDQMLPAYVMEIAGNLHGIPGLFISGIFGAALSTLSVGLNSTSVVLLEDFVKGCFNLKPSDRNATIFVKSIVIILGIVALSLVFLVEKLGGVLALTSSLAAIAAGVSFGVFTLGMLFPWSNSKGAFIGSVSGFLLASWASYGANAASASRAIVAHKLPVEISHCANVSSDFLNQFNFPNEADVFPLYRLSYHWIAGLGFVTVIIVGLIVSFISGATKTSDLDRNLLTPAIHRWLPRAESEENCTMKYSIRDSSPTSSIRGVKV